MKKQYKYALAGLSFAASTATSIYFGVKGFSTKPPFENTAFQGHDLYKGSKFIRGDYRDSAWIDKSDNFYKELSSESLIRNAFKDAGGLEDYPDFINGYDSKSESDKKDSVKKFLHAWCLKNRASKNEEIFYLIDTWCTDKKGSVSRRRN